MALAIERLDDITVISAEGQMNSGNALALETELLSHVEGGAHRIVLDLSLLSYISSAGLRVVLLLAKRLKQVHGTLVLCALQARVREVFEISGFFAILTVVDTREAALRLMTQSKGGSWTQSKD